MTNIQKLIFEQVKESIKLITNNSIDIDTFVSSINWEPNNDRFNGDVFKGTIYLKNNDSDYYTFTGILKSFKEFDLKELSYVSIESIRHDLI